MLQVELTQNDAIFVLTAVASPVSFYLWFSSLLALLWRLPGRLTVGMGAREQTLLSLLSLGSFALWATLIGIILDSSRSFQFSQPACNREYGRKSVYSLIWAAPSAIQSVIILVVLRLASLYADRKRSPSLIPPKSPAIGSVIG